MPNDERKFIELNCLSKPHLIFSIRNSYNGQIILDENNMPLSAEQHHGIGTKSIAAFVKKYNAVIDYQTDNNLFTLRVLISKFK